MISEKRYHILIWIAVILFAMNLATIGSLFYHTRNKETLPSSPGNRETLAPDEQGARFFRDQLALDPDQMLCFREANRGYNRNTHRVARELDMLRMDLVAEMTRAHPDTMRIDSLSGEIGNCHRVLKRLTAAYYLEMRNHCTPEQKNKLDEIFLKMVQQDESDQPARGRRLGRGWDSLPPRRGQ